MTIVTTNNEAEALLLEAQLIKRFRPRLQRRCCATTKASPSSCCARIIAFPRIQKHRGARRAKGNYYGPFASAGEVSNTLNALQKLFLLRSCTDSFFSNARPALPALPDPALLGALRRRGSARRTMPSWSATRRRLPRGQVDRGAGQAGQSRCRRPRENMDFELAAIYPRPAEGAHLHPGQPGDQRRRAWGTPTSSRCASKHGVMGIQAFFIRGGQNWGHRSFFPAHTNDVPEEEVLASFLMQFYEEVPPPRIIFVDRELEEAELLQEALAERAGAQGRASPCPSAAPAAGCSSRRSAMPRKRSTGAWPKAPPRRSCCARSPTCSNCPSRPTGSRSTTTAISRAPTRSARWSSPGRRVSARASIASSTSRMRRPSPGDDFGMMREVLRAAASPAPRPRIPIAIQANGRIWC